MLILLAHGSRDPRWREPFERLLADLQQAHGNDALTLAYMEMAEPTLMQAVEPALVRGVRHFTILPLFMAAGAHLASDIPRLAEGLKASKAGVSVTVLPPVGEHPTVVQAIARVVASSVQPQMG